jgi:hypothetical protein
MNPEGPQTPKIVDLAQVREKESSFLTDDEAINTSNLPESPETLTAEELAILFPPKSPDSE